MMQVIVTRFLTQFMANYVCRIEGKRAIWCDCISPNHIILFVHFIPQNNFSPLIPRRNITFAVSFTWFFEFEFSQYF